MSISLRDVLLSSALLAMTACSSSGREPAPPSSLAPESRRDLAAGSVVGLAAAHETFAWLGIPFAEPPVGALRWRAPQPPEAWDGVREARSFGRACVQLANALGDEPDAEPGSVTGSEDCLHLNLWAPREAAGLRLPVMFWIHGGGNSIGHAGSYDGSTLAGTQDVVVVTVNYRLGLLGWFRHPALVAQTDDPEDRSGNFGTLDLLRALEWVRDNIAAFGGDPGNVTIFGESAGAANVFSLLASPRATGLFHRAIAQSGGTWTSSVAEAQNPLDATPSGGPNSSYEVALRVVAPDAEDRASARAELEAAPSERVAARLRAATPREILPTPSEPSLGMYESPQLIRDGHVLPETAIDELLARGRYNQVPTLMGTNRDETKLFMFLDPKEVRYLLWVLPRLRDPAGYEVRAEYGSKSWKLNGADGPAQRMRSAQGPSVFAYRFDWDEEPSFLGSDFAVMLGAAHGIEIPFVFGSFRTSFFGDVFTNGNEPGRLALADATMSYWTQFAYEGDPGRGRQGTLPRWKAWDASSPAAAKFIVLDTAADGGIRMSSDSLTREGLLAQLAADPRLASEQARCEIFANLVQWSGFDPSDHAAAGCGHAPEDVAAR